jgi:hypothetical protein
MWVMRQPRGIVSESASSSRGSASGWVHARVPSRRGTWNRRDRSGREAGLRVPGDPPSSRPLPPQDQFPSNEKCDRVGILESRPHFEPRSSGDGRSENGSHRLGSGLPSRWGRGDQRPCSPPLFLDMLVSTGTPGRGGSAQGPPLTDIVRDRVGQERECHSPSGWAVGL